MKYKAVLFDLFGTLLENVEYAGYSSVLRETSSLLKLRHEDYMRLWGETSLKRMNGGFRTLEENLEYICRELKVDVTQSQLRLVKMVRLDYMALALAPRSGAIEILSHIKSHGYILGLVSNCSMDVPVVWPHTAMAPFFDAVLFSSTCGLLKPDQQIYRLATEKLGVQPEDCLFIDDFSVNLEAAAKMGISSVLIDNPGENELTHAIEPKGKWDGPRVTSLREILPFLEENNEI